MQPQGRKRRSGAPASVGPGFALSALLVLAEGPAVTARVMGDLPATAAVGVVDTLRAVTGLLAARRANTREVPQAGVVATMGIRD